jgi:cysteine desulfurase
VIYLDHAATTPLRPEAIEAMRPHALGRYGNPSGSHAISRAAKNALEESRERAAVLIGARPNEIVFTGGGTESDNLALKGRALSASTRGGVVISAVEHDAVIEAAAFLARLGSEVTTIGVDSRGLVDPEVVAAAVDENTAVVSVMAANNETGVIEPVSEIVRLVKERGFGTVVHTDAVQAYPTTGLDVNELGVDLLTLAAHKFGGPQGVGLLYVREGTRLEPLLHGGGQELGRRSGTHNVAGIVGMVAAMEAAADDRDRFISTVTEARRRFEAKLSDRTERTVPEELTLPQHSHLHLPVESETMLVRLDRLGLAASAASACQSGAVDISHVLSAMGVDSARARHSLRFTFGWSTTVEEAEQAAEIVIAALDATA